MGEKFARTAQVRFELERYGVQNWRLSFIFEPFGKQQKAVPSLKVLDKISSFFSMPLAELLARKKSRSLYFPRERQVEAPCDFGITSRFLLPKDRIFSSSRAS